MGRQGGGRMALSVVLGGDGVDLGVGPPNGGKEDGGHPSDTCQSAR